MSANYYLNVVLYMIRLEFLLFMLAELMNSELGFGVSGSLRMGWGSRLGWL